MWGAKSAQGACVLRLEQLTQQQSWTQSEILKRSDGKESPGKHVEHQQKKMRLGAKWIEMLRTQAPHRVRHHGIAFLAFESSSPFDAFLFGRLVRRFNPEHDMTPYRAV